MSFKIIAIRALDKCNPKFLKNLNKDEFYTFHNSYDFSEYSKKNTIGYFEKKDVDLYSSENVKINISAIVGKNGSGKSSVVELIYAFIFCIANSKEIDLINRDRFIKDHSSSKKDNESLEYNRQLINLIDLDLKDFETLNLELFYLADYENKLSNSKIFKITKDGTFKIQEYIFDGINYIECKKNVYELNKDFLSKEFFYSIVSNYSLYGLNTRHSGIWMKSIFHKNDGYQTPIVLNPMRTDGNIEINTVTYLSKSRLLTNILSYYNPEKKKETSYLINDKKVENVIFKFDFSKLNIIDDNKFSKILKKEFIFKVDNKLIFLESSQKYGDKYFFKIFNAFTNIESEKTDNKNFIVYFNSLSLVEKITVDYILNKVKGIVEKYPTYNKYNGLFRLRKTSVLDNFLDEIILDQSHVVYKLRQAINFLRYNLINVNDVLKEYDFNIENLSQTIIGKNNELKEIGNKEFNGENDNFIKFEHFKFNLIYFIPPSFLEVDILFKDKGSFNDLSSGEKQRVFSFASIIYHLRNLKSVKPVKGNLIYSYYSLIFDEIELYFHPEFQKTFINDLVNSINTLDYRFDINIIFATHSPFILSDIPNSNIMYLENGGCLKKEVRPTKSFGANITDLLADSFFIENGLIGDFAKGKITNVIKWLNDKERDMSKKEEYKKIIEIIDEPLVKYKLKEMYLEKIIDTDYIDAEIERLNDLKAKTNG